jgi:hypothetical protein
MASNVKSSTSNQQATRVQQYVDGQLEKTRRQVKWNELIVACLTWAAAVAAFLLVLALIDAWVVSFSTTWRWIAWATLMLGSVAWLVLAIVPLFLRKINLNYAAQMIEQATPDVKNRILNYSLLRKNDRPVNAAVMDAVSRQAAHKLNSIPSDNTIDRSQLIRVGFILVGLMVFAVAYKLISPRDPLQTVQRILFPGHALAKPASVQISDVTPGNASVFFGDSLQVTARVKGPHRPEDVHLLVSSQDGQITDLSIPMAIDETGRSYLGLISPGEGGIQQALSYRIAARDGVSPEFDVLVKANPSIAIETIELTPPAYTRLPKRTLAGRGDIETIEGTEAMIFAAANLPIEVAYIELLNAVPSDDPQNPNATVMKPAAPPIEMRLLPDNRASGRFNVTLNSARTWQRATHYQIRFVSTNDDRNESPNVYPIRVTPDLAPEIRVIKPRSRMTDVASNGRLPILIEANDLDFAIDSVVLNIDHQGRQLVRQSLKLKSTNGNQRVNCRFLFEPSRYRLQPGDQVVFQAVASDNRISIKSLAPDPNISQTDNFTISITEPDSEPDRQPADDGNDDTDSNDNSSDETDPESQDNSNGDDSRNDGDQPPDDPMNQPDQDGTSDPESGETETGDDDSNEETGEGSQSNNQPPDDGANADEQSPPDGGEGSGQEQEAGADEQNSGGNQSGNQENSEAAGRNERRNDGVSDRGNSQGSNDGSGNEGGAEGSGQSDGSNDPSETGTGGTPDGSDSQAPAGTNQDDPNARAADQPNAGGAKGSDTNDGARSEPSGDGSDQEGTRDGSLKDGKRERLPEDAHDGEKFEKLDELLKDQPPSDRDGNPKKGDQQNRDPKNGDQPGSGDQPQNNSPQNDPSKGGSSQEQPGSPDNQQPQPPSDGKQPNGSGSEPQGGQGSEGSKGAKGESDPQQKESSDGAGGENPSQPSDSAGQSSGDSQSDSDSPGQPGQGDPNQAASDSQSQSGANSGTGEAGEPGQQPAQSSDVNANGQGDQPGEGATPSGEQSSGAGTSQATREQVAEEKANLDHAKKATDLVLNKLEDQLQNPDPDLLDKMNWAEQDLREFLDRWKRMKQSAQTGDPTAKKQYEEAIKSLGLRPDNRSRTSKNRDVDASGLNQDGSVIEPPADLAPDFNEFLRDRNRAR